MPLQKSCSLDALRANIGELISAGHPRDQAVAIAHEALRQACHDEGKPTPATKDVAGVAKEFKRPRGQRTNDYLETALAAARGKLSHKDFAVIHQAARSSAGGRASARSRMTPVEKSLLLGPALLTAQELWAAVERAEQMAAADLRRGIETGAAELARLLRGEEARRDILTKDDPGPGDVHVNEAMGGEGKPKRKPKKRQAESVEELVAKADRSDDPGVMIALRLPEATAQAIALDSGEPATRLHVTLAYLGRLSKVGAECLPIVADAIRCACTAPILRGTLSGIGRFAATESSDGKDVVISLVDVPGLTDLRANIVAELLARGIPVSSKHDFTPHITLAYVSPEKPAPVGLNKLARLIDVYFDKVVLSINDADTVFELGQPDPLDEARMAALVQQAREEEDESVAVPSAPMLVEDCDAGVAILKSADGETVSAACALDVEPGDLVELSADAGGAPVVEGYSAASQPSEMLFAMKAMTAARELRGRATPIPFTGPEGARLVFVSGAPSELELARGEALVGPDGAAFIERYLAPLGVTKSEVAVGFACPVPPRVPLHELSAAQTQPWDAWLEGQLARWPDATVVAVTKAAAAALGDRALLWLPHPYAARMNEARYDDQIARKMRRVRKALDDGFVFAEDGTHRSVASEGARHEILAGRIGGSLAAGPGRALVRVAKAADEKQIVYGVVLDPYEIDTQNEWSPPATVEATAHDYMAQSRVIGREHRKQASAGTRLVESWIHDYPTPEDRKAAHSLLPHQAFETRYGNDMVHSGAWIAGVQLSDEDWAAYKRGDITGFSVGGFSSKLKVTTDAMPAVTFIRR